MHRMVKKEYLVEPAKNVFNNCTERVIERARGKSCVTFCCALELNKWRKKIQFQTNKALWERFVTLITDVAYPSWRWLERWCCVRWGQKLLSLLYSAPKILFSSLILALCRLNLNNVSEDWIASLTRNW